MDFRSDPVVKLPVEICYQVFQYLEIYQIFQAQRVSREWYRLLSSPAIVDSLVLRPWVGYSGRSANSSKGLSKGNLNTPSSLTPGGEASLQARHIDNLRNGLAFSMSTGKWHTSFQTYETRILSHVDFAGSILAWTGRQTGCVELKCLVSGQEVSLFTPAQEEIDQIALSDMAIVVMTDSGKCCAWDLLGGIRSLEDQSPRFIETHRVEMQTVFLSGRTFAALYRAEKGMQFTTWNFEGQQSHQFRLKTIEEKFPNTHNVFLIISPGGRSIVFFERVIYERGCDKSNHARFTRMSLKGQIESSGHMEHPDIEGYSLHSEETNPVSTVGRVTLWSYVRSSGGSEAQNTNLDVCDLMRVVYDTNTDRMELQRHSVKHAIPTQFSARDFLWWKDVAYFWNCANGLGQLEVLDLKTSICKKAEMSASNLVPESSESPMNDIEARDFFLLGNESFLICVRYVNFYY